MKVVEIRGYWLEHELTEPLRNSRGTIRVRSALLVELVAENGVSGWGETQRFPLAAWTAIESQLSAHVLSHDVEDIASIWRSMTDGAGLHVLLGASAVDGALWDLRGRLEGRPVSALLGGRLRDRVAAYASGPFMKAGEMPYRDAVRQASDFVAQGFAGIKLRCGLSPQEDAVTVAALRRELGDGVQIMVDVNKGYTRIAARELVQRTAEAGLAWIEEPLAPTDLDGYVELSRVSATPLAAGESWSEIDEFASFLIRKAVGIVQPDVYLCGGLSGALRVAAVAEALRVPCMPHVFGGVVNFYLSLQLAAVLPSYGIGGGREYPYFECDRTANPLRTLAGDIHVDADGTVAIPDAPGIGVEIDRETFAPFVRQAWECHL